MGKLKCPTIQDAVACFLAASKMYIFALAGVLLLHYAAVTFPHLDTLPAAIVFLIVYAEYVYNLTKLVKKGFENGKN